MSQNIRLGVNIDHVATLRQARGTQYPDPVQAAFVCQTAGADGITIHLREDRRHIQDRDVRLISEVLDIPLNLEMAATDEMVEIALKTKPTYCCLVPEKREELTTEGGLDVVGQEKHIRSACDRLGTAGISVSLFIDATTEQIDATVRCGAPIIELHTGHYADAATAEQRQAELDKIIKGAAYAAQQGLIVNAGHGLHYHNVQPIAAIPVMNELNIGHSIISHAVFVGLERAVQEMKSLLY